MNMIFPLYKWSDVDFKFIHNNIAIYKQCVEDYHMMITKVISYFKFIFMVLNSAKFKV